MICNQTLGQTCDTLIYGTLDSATLMAEFAIYVFQLGIETCLPMKLYLILTQACHAIFSFFLLTDRRVQIRSTYIPTADPSFEKKLWNFPWLPDQ